MHADGKDVPEGGSLMAAGERFFADGTVEFHGQVIGLVVATSQVRCCTCGDRLLPAGRCPVGWFNGSILAWLPSVKRKLGSQLWPNI